MTARKAKTDALSAGEKTAIALQDEGRTYNQIALAMGAARPEIRELIRGARIKLAARAAGELRKEA